MSNHITSSELAATGAALFSSDRWFDPVEEAVRGRVRGFIEEVIEAERKRGRVAVVGVA